MSESAVFKTAGITSKCVQRRIEHGNVKTGADGQW